MSLDKLIQLVSKFTAGAHIIYVGPNKGKFEDLKDSHSTSFEHMLRYPLPADKGSITFICHAAQAGVIQDCIVS
jgi:hypothetical protein